jgi:trehalose-6-phosphate synthase
MSAPSTPGAKREQRLIVVSNRLPVTIKKDAQGKYTYKASREPECSDVSS